MTHSIVSFGKQYLRALAYSSYLLTVGSFGGSSRSRIKTLSAEAKSFFGGADASAPVGELPVISFESQFGPSLNAQLLGLDAVDGNVTIPELVAIVGVVQSLRPKAIFEIGTFDGRTSLNMVANAPPDCVLSTLDLPSAGESSAALPLESDDLKYVRKESSGSRFRNHPLKERIIQLYGDSAKFDFDRLKGTCDLVFVDGSHAYEYVHNDAKAALRLLRPTGGVILFHDYNTPYWPGVTRALNELRAKNAEFAGLAQFYGTSLAIARINSGAATSSLAV